MWLHPLMPVLSRLVTHSYYRLSVGGAKVPATGPVLVVANHTNSLMDPALIVVAGGRTLRFMAKAPLFTYPGIGWLVRAVGSVPVYRRQDNPRGVRQNFDVFEDVHEALAQGYALGIFPEGTSHSASGLQPLKTGAARIALGAAQRIGHAFPIVPVGLVFRDRRTFRSSARVIVGEAPVWDDLAARGADDKDAVRELTRRIETSMRAVTVNLQDWSDEQLVHCAARVWHAEFGGGDDLGSDVERVRLTTEALARLRAGDDHEWRHVARALRGHDRLLARLGLTPETLHLQVTREAALLWLLRRIPLLLLLPFALAGLVLFWIPRELTGHLGALAAKKEGEDSVPTFRVFYGAVIFLVWFLFLAMGASTVAGPLVGIATFLALPAVGFAALTVSEWRRLSWHEIRRFWTLRFHRDRVAELRDRQRALAWDLRALFEAASNGS
ncbi:MAG: 1-acyl-sn-glycerol-3-phosphate acyltransferase [Gemmatimonadetes bacterium]|nr:1-acyl-sn-glycerol-3-phosphate acyltransferase [Gemmatimonadota bacterium]